MDLDFPSGYTEPAPPKPLSFDNPPGLWRPYSDMSAEVHVPGFPDPVRSACRVSHPLDGLLPPAPSGPEGPVPLMGFTLQSVSPSQSRTSFDAVALLPFLASRSPALRTRRPRCPAASGRCSPRGSVPILAEAKRADTLLGFLRLSRAFPAHRGAGFPAPSFLRFPPPPSGRAAVRRSKAFPSARVGRSLAGTARLS
jgi:hypothetical protein